MIGLAIPELRQTYFAELADRISRKAAPHKVSVLIDQTGGTREGELAVLAGERLRLTDGVLFSPESLGQDDIHLLDVDFPLVLLGERMFGGTTDHVTMHNVGSARAATAHLISIGRRRIAVIGAHPSNRDDIRSANLRIRGYREALEVAGIPHDPRLVRIAVPWHRENGAVAMRELIEEGVPFDAVFCLTDTLGLGVLRALGEARVRVPDEVAVIGFDNIDEARFSVPSLSSVEPGGDQIAQTAVELLLERVMEKDDRVAPRQIRADYHIVERESTGRSEPVDATNVAFHADPL
ncbi:LacI family DNA-binding transcriptional regulator [Tessaracoccus antarcticus]|uniref:LacI family DNA-binding transcriptional regulator n=1 Tax=Tessaracoccus antarcticus TaxID=2479848 RepID=UPI001F23C055|nr:substrate-binding domain-containing protein [Tessaracoccus antarcticus]